MNKSIIIMVPCFAHIGQIIQVYRLRLDSLKVLVSNEDIL